MKSDYVLEESGSCLLGDLCAKEAESVYVSPCAYCGMPADSVDHIPPRHMRVQLSELELQAMIVMEVPACRECNSALGAKPLLTVGARREWVKSWLSRHYAKYLRIPEWREEDLAALGQSLQGMVRRNIAIRDTVRDRIRWPKV